MHTFDDKPFKNLPPIFLVISLKALIYLGFAFFQQALGNF
jgi:hypothetical protein